MLVIMQAPKKRKPQIIEMNEMQPLDVGIITDSDLLYDNHIVLRTASWDKFEVMDLTNPGQDMCWTGTTDLKVLLLPPDECITIKLFNKE